jgi:hypothetical protein
MNSKNQLVTVDIDDANSPTILMDLEEIKSNINIGYNPLIYCAKQQAQEGSKYFTEFFKQELKIVPFQMVVNEHCRKVSVNFILSQLAGMRFPEQGQAYDFVKNLLKE